MGWLDTWDSPECDTAALRRLQSHIEQREHQRIAAFRDADGEGDE